ncbi:UBX domain-containing protein 7-like [Elysia marginata]|uniref:UBX domain-containing protein 7-like n=1 Tax=Elysia marginata TaxID=1093978 RepID=A0AAV4JI06_9GAST|nr:UBX domain-containing protein 7-like [Elysia marginata]
MATSSGVQTVGEQTIEQFIAVTGADRSVAVNLLEACAGNLDLAVGMHMDSGQAGPSSASADDSPVMAMEDGVRAPIPQRTEVLVEDDSSKSAYRMRRPRRFAPSVFDGFRDFQAETHQFDDSLRGKRLSKKRNLQDLFRPPVDMTYKGTFQSARDFGSSQNKWLLVNVQNVQEFPCQVLNRDVWSSQDTRAMIKDNFIFWQVYNDSEEGKRFMQFYKLNQWPYVAVIDPFTGENQIVWNKIADGNVFCELAKDFLSMCPVPDSSQLPSAAKRQRREPTIVDATEEEQLEAAIQASLSETKKKADPAPQYIHSSDSEADVIGDSDDDEVETFSDSDDVIVSSPPSSAAPVSSNGLACKQKNCASSFTAASKNSSSSNKSKSLVKKSLPSTGNHRNFETTQTGLSSSSLSHPSSLLSAFSSTSCPSSSSASSSSSQSHSHRGKKLSSTLNNSEIRIRHEDIDDDDNYDRLDDEDRRASSVWAASGPSTSSLSQQQPTGLGLGALGDSEENSILDMLDMGTREAEVGTPPVCTLDDDEGDDDKSANDRLKDSAEEGSRPDAEVDTDDWKKYWGNTHDPMSKIMLRFPDNKREQVELPCSSQLKALSAFCGSRGFPSKDFELVTNFPRKKLSQMAPTTTLKEAGLHPQDTVFVQDL